MYPIPPTETLAETKICKHCGASFPITDKDLAFYDKVSPVFSGKKYAIPAPTLCPDCRQQRRLSFRNERKLYKRKCDATGRDIISIYSPDKPFKVYHQDEWWSDKWDPLDYGRDFDFGRPFFEQFGELVGGVPRMALYYSSCENSSFCNQVADCKDSYLIVSCSEAQNCMYGKRMNNSQYCVDCLLTIGSEHCYECIDCHNCHDCLHCRNIENGRNLRYCLDCIGCSDCWFCVGLQNASFSILNKGYSKEEFERKISQMLREGIDNYAEAFKNLNDSYPKKYLDLLQVEETVGDHVFQSKESFFVFDAGNVQNVRYGQFVNDTKDSADIDYGCCVSSRSYEIVAG